MRNLIPTHAGPEHIAEYLAEPLEVHKCCVRHTSCDKYTACKAICIKFLPSLLPSHPREACCSHICFGTRLVQQHTPQFSSQRVVTPLDACTSKQVATAGLVVPHPEKVTPNSKARIHRDFGYGGEDSFYCAWGPRCVLAGAASLPLSGMHNP